MERYIAHLLKGAEYRTKQFMGSQVKNQDSMQYEESKATSGKQSLRFMHWPLPLLYIFIRTAAFIKMKNCIQQ